MSYSRISSWCRTEMRMKEISFEWTITNFSQRPEDSGEAIVSSVFPDNAKTTWRLLLYPHGEYKWEKSKASIYLEMVASESCKVKAEYKFTIRRPGTHHLVNGESDAGTVMDFNNPNDKTKIYRFPKADTPLQEFLFNDTLVLLCEIKMFGDTTNISGQNAGFVVPSEEKRFPNYTYLDDLFETQKYADILFRVSGQEFKAHKCILAIRSRVFQAMFEHDMKENLENRVEINDIDPDIFQELLRFVYTGKVKKLEELAGELLKVGNKYSLEDLEDICEDTLLQNITVENVSRVLILADLCNREKLKSNAIMFIVQNVKAVLNTNETKDLISYYPGIVIDLLRAMASLQYPSLEALSRNDKD